jgi:hypothetical protein
MKQLDLTNFEHPVFEFIRPTAQRIHKSVAWLVRCKHCGKRQLVGAAQVRARMHNRCIHCMIPKETVSREVSDESMV